MRFQTAYLLQMMIMYVLVGDITALVTPDPKGDGTSSTSGDGSSSSSSTTPATDGPDSTTPVTSPASGYACGLSHAANATAQPLHTPDYPNAYPSDFTCTYHIYEPNGLAVSVTFLTMDLESSTYCSYDRISIYDGTSTSDTLIGTYCGSTDPGTIVSSASDLYMVFESDYSIEYSGAYGTFQTYDNSYPNCKLGYTSYTASVTPQTLSNSDYPSTYRSNLDEYYLMTNPSATSKLIIELTYSNIERGTNCVYDRLVIYGGGCTSFGVLHTHCGSYLSRWELSGSEFLIHFHTDGSIEKGGFSLDYYTGVGGTAPPTTTTTTQGPPVSAEVNLINEVLTNYSSENFPARNLSIPIGTAVDVSLVGINGLDEVQQKLTTTILFNIKWTDSNIQWPVSKLSGISKILVPQNDVWKPDVALLNSFTQITQMGSKFMFVVIKNDGECNWKPYQILDSTCRVDMTNYPYDTQTCELQFSTWSSSSSQVNTTVGANGMARHESFVENAEWHLMNIGHRTEIINGQTTAIFTLTLKRNPSFVVFYISIPVVLLAVLNSITFALPVQSGEKASFSITVFLSFVVYVIVTFDKMPESSDSLSLFALCILIMTCMSALTLMISVLQLRMMTLKTKHKPVTNCTRVFTQFILKVQTKMLCISEQLEKQRLDELERQKQNRRKRASDDNDDEEEETDDDTVWKDFVSALDFVCFWVFLVATAAISAGFLVHLGIQ